MQSRFRRFLMDWNRLENSRDMPWKGERDPYRIWLSEVILQQTRVDQGWAYYERFIDRYPTIKDLAAAPDKAVFKLWEGLGYYSRCKNLLHTAREIAMHRDGIFPEAHAEILALKGVGPYTAAAIASFAFNLPYPVVDGNVIRVLARVFGIRSSVDDGAIKKEIQELAAGCMDRQQPGVYNQAMMDFGAVVCKPKLPVCGHCPMTGICKAYQWQQTDQLPVKTPKAKKKKRWLYYAVLISGKKILLRERLDQDIWKHLHEPYLLSVSASQAVRSLKEIPVKTPWMADAGIVDIQVSEIRRQLLTHLDIRGRFLLVRLEKNQQKAPQGWNWVALSALDNLAFPKFVRDYLEETGLVPQS